MDEVSQSIQLELLECFRALRNNRVGMEEALSTSKVLESIVLCLDFGNLTLASKTIEVLTGACFFSEEGISLS